MVTSACRTQVAGRSRAPRSTLSQRLFGIVWEPVDLEGVVATPYDDGDALAFVSAHYPRIFGGDHAGPLLVEGTSEAKRRFVDEMDVFTFRRGDAVIGIWMGHPMDWSSYYLRTIAVLEHERARGVAGRFFEHLKSRLRAAGVQRLEVDVQPTNGPMVDALQSRGFVTTGTLATERWGLHTRMTLYLSEAARGAFVSTYAPNRV
jgi:GNAT superfamily N-acetyltransferase